MPALRTATFGTTLLSFWLLHSFAVSADSEPTVYYTSRDNSGLVSAPVGYRDTMLIAVTDEGVAAIVFQVKDEKLNNKSAKYRFRFLKDAESPEVAGTGIVLDSVGDKEEVTIKAGAIRLGWSGGGHDRGWIYYQPEAMQISIAKADRFDDSVVKLPGENLPVEKVDLRRFLRGRK